MQKLCCNNCHLDIYQVNIVECTILTICVAMSKEIQMKIDQKVIFSFSKYAELNSTVQDTSCIEEFGYFETKISLFIGYL